MTWLAHNWIWILFGVAFVAMHLFGHGGHGGHGSGQRRSRDSSAAPDGQNDASRQARTDGSTGSHRH